MLDFLRILNYKHELEPQQAKQALLHGDPHLIYPILSWMLQRLPELQKRAYLARFLVSVEVPEHMFADEEVVEVYQNYKDLQEEHKVDQLKQKLSGVDRFSDMLDAVHKLRLQQDE